MAQISLFVNANGFCGPVGLLYGVQQTYIPDIYRAVVFHRCGYSTLADQSREMKGMKQCARKITHSSWSTTSTEPQRVAICTHVSGNQENKNENCGHFPRQNYKTIHHKAYVFSRHLPSETLRSSNVRTANLFNWSSNCRELYKDPMMMATPVPFHQYRLSICEKLADGNRKQSVQHQYNKAPRAKVTKSRAGFASFQEDNQETEQTS